MDALFRSGSEPKYNEAGMRNADAAKVIMPRSTRLAPRPCTKNKGIRVPIIPLATPFGRYVR